MDNSDFIIRYTGAFSKEDCGEIIKYIEHFEGNNLLTYDETRLDIEVEIYDLNGKRIINEKSKQISLAGYPSGMYNMIIIYDKMRWNKRVIKQ